MERLKPTRRVSGVDISVVYTEVVVRLKRILLVHHGRGLGGAPTGMLQAAVALRKSEEFQPYALFSAEGPASMRAREVGLSVFIRPLAAGFYTEIRPTFSLKMVARFLRDLGPSIYSIAKLVRDEQIDLVYLNTRSPVSAAVASHLEHVPVIWHVREPMVPQSRIGRLMIAIIQRFATIIVTNSDYVASVFVNHNKVIRVYNGVPLERYCVEEEKAVATRLEWGFEPSVPLAGVVSAVSRIKGHYVLLDAIPYVLEWLPKARFVVVGSSGSLPPGYERTWRHRLRRLVGRYNHLERLRRMTQERGLEEVIYFAGWRSDIPAVMAALDLVVFAPIVPEGFGRPLAEAGAASRPVVTSDIGPAREIVVDGITGLLVPPSDPRGLAEAIVSLLADRERAKAMGRAGRERVQRYFSEEQYTTSMLNVFRQAIEG